MTDTLSPEQRSRTMARVRARDTRPELVVRSALHAMGWRFTVRGPRNRELPGRPDIVLPRHRAAVFVHGCFWHRHPGCPRATTPASRPEYWLPKFRRTVRRDAAALEALARLGWRALVLWECELPGRRKDAKARAAELRARLREFLGA